MTLEWDIGTAVTVSETFNNLAGNPANPSTVTLRIRKPDGTVLTPTPTSAVTGIWTSIVVPDQAGIWEVGWAGTGTVTKTSEGRFNVRHPRVLV